MAGNFLFCAVSEKTCACFPGSGNVVLKEQVNFCLLSPSIYYGRNYLVESIALYQVFQVLDTAQTWTVQYQSWPWAQAAKSMGWGKTGLKENVTHQGWPGQLEPPGSLAFPSSYYISQALGEDFLVSNTVPRGEGLVWAAAGTPALMQLMLVRLCTQKTGTVPQSFVSTHRLQQAPCFYQHVHGNSECLHTVSKGGWTSVLEDKEGAMWLRNCPRLTVASWWQKSSGKCSLCLPCCNSSFTSHSQSLLRAGCWARQTLLWPIVDVFMTEINSPRCRDCPDSRLGVEMNS